MQTKNNSNTINWCPDCKSKTSKHQCSYNHGSYSLPCNILRKLAKKVQIAYHKVMNANKENIQDIMSYDFQNAIQDLMFVDYANKQDIEKEIILSAMLHYTFHSYEPDEPDLIKYLFELDDYSDIEITKIEILSNEIQKFVRILNDCQ